MINDGRRELHLDIIVEDSDYVIVSDIVSQAVLKRKREWMFRTLNWLVLFLLVNLMSSVALIYQAPVVTLDYKISCITGGNISNVSKVKEKWILLSVPMQDFLAEA